MKKSCKCLRAKGLSVVKNALGLCASCHFEIGEVYLFHPDNPACPDDSSLWGVFDKRRNDAIYLETSTTNLVDFDAWRPLPVAFRYVRLATRPEMRDYIYRLALCDHRTATLR